MKEASLVFPDQLFKNPPHLDLKRPVYLVEEFLFFKVQYFHKQRLVLLRAAMKSYEHYLKENGFNVIYIESSHLNKRGDVFTLLQKEKIENLHVADFTDDWLKEDLENAVSKNHWKLSLYKSPMFICSKEEVIEFFKGKKKPSMAQFYAYQRKKLNILMDDEGPVGGKYSFDIENRKRLPKGVKIPHYSIPKDTSEIKEAINYIERAFPEAIGEAVPFLYPVNFKEATKALQDFIHHKLSLFGDYEDAIKENESFIFHSVLSPLLNCGLLTPEYVIETVMSTYKEAQIPLNSLEGFIRQIIGWREFMRACYLIRGKEERTSNFFQHTSQLPKGFWNGTTGILPVDTTIKRILKTGYCHHIERLMVLGNFLLLTETDPNAIYEWFMGYFVDAYDWVMVPNVYSMSQYADKGGITTKPYISGANYILKMSDYSKGSWVDIWDGLYWRFLSKHKTLFGSNPRTKMLLGLLGKNAETINPKIKLAEKWLSQNKTELTHPQC